MKPTELIETVGLDGALYLRFFYIGFEYFTALSVFCGMVLLPINAWSSGPGPANEKFKFIDLTMENVDPGSLVLWAHVACAYLATILLARIVKREYKRFVKV